MVQRFYLQNSAAWMQHKLWDFDPNALVWAAYRMIESEVEERHFLFFKRKVKRPQSVVTFMIRAFGQQFSHDVPESVYMKKNVDDLWKILLPVVEGVRDVMYVQQSLRNALGWDANGAPVE